MKSLEGNKLECWKRCTLYHAAACTTGCDWGSKALISRMMYSMEFGIVRHAVAAFMSVYRAGSPIRLRIVGTISALRLSIMPAPHSLMSLTVPASCGMGRVVACAMIGRQIGRAHV